MTARPAGLILAGGQARRLGGIDKPLIALAGRSLLDWALATLAPQAVPIALSANGDPGRYARFGLPVLGDGALLGKGPLAGVLAGLDWAAQLGHSALLSVPGDTPFIPADLLVRLGPAPACASSAARAHYLVALWPVAAREALRAYLGGAGPYRVRDFSAAIGMRKVDFPVGTWDPFHNVNTLEDLAQARAWAGDAGSGGAP